MKPVVDGLQQEYGEQLDFVVMPSVDQNAQESQLAGSHGVNAVPTMVLVSAEGAELERWIGTVPASVLTAAFDRELGAGP